MPTVAINPPKTPVTKGSSGISAATVPNICKMPGPPAPFVPTPLPNIGTSDDTPDGYSTSVKIEGNAVAIKGATFKSKGDIASKGTGGGLISAQTHGKTEFVAPGSLDVKIEGKNVHLLTDAMLNNCGSPANSATTPGVVQGAVPALPVLVFDSADFPEKVKTIKAGNNNKDEATLTRQTDKADIRANRRDALATATKGPTGTSLDEFPFASTLEGGGKPGSAVRAIPVKEQNKQGGKMSSFYQKHNIGDGDKFVVKVI